MCAAGSAPATWQLEKATGRIAGYYTLSAADVPVSELPADMTRRLPRYPSVPVARIGRLAIDRRFQGRRLGGALLLNAAMRALRSEIAVFALVVDAKDDEAAAFYRHHGFTAFASNPVPAHRAARDLPQAARLSEAACREFHWRLRCSRDLLHTAFESEFAGPTTDLMRISNN